MRHYLSRLQDATVNYWDKPALNTIDGESFTYGQVATIMKKLGIFFKKIGVTGDDKIAVCAKNSARWGISFLAVATNGMVNVPILNDFTPESICKLIDHSESVGLFTTADKWAKLDVAKMPLLKFVIDMDSWELLWAKDEGIREARASVESEFAKEFPNGFGPGDVHYEADNLDKLAAINYTSGTTSDPKGVMLTYRNFSANIDFSQRNVPSSSKYSMVSMLPMAHMYGLVIEFIYPLCNGTAIYWLGKAPTPTTLFAAFEKVHPYLLITVPLVMEKIFKLRIIPQLSKQPVKFLLHIPGISNLILGKVRKSIQAAFGGQVQQFIMGGAALNPEVEHWLRRIGLNYTVGYGMTEACPLLAYEHYSKYVPGSCGKAMDFATVRIDSEDPEHVVGEIQAKGDNICIGYYKNPEASANLFTEDGFMRTGDLGIIDKNGNIFIKGRCKTMILGPSGQNIYPEELENVINNLPYVAESLVVDRGGKLVGLVYLDETKTKGMSHEDRDGIADCIRVSANNVFPVYSKLVKVELRDAPFEKTPKMSIKRFLYK